MAALWALNKQKLILNYWKSICTFKAPVRTEQKRTKRKYGLENDQF